MAEWHPIARSPISGTMTSASLVVIDESLLAKVIVRASATGEVGSALPLMGRAERVGTELRVGSGPGEWLILGDGHAGRWVQAPEQVIDVDAADEFMSIVDVTHGRALVRLTGPDAPRILAKVCAIDLRESKAPNGSALRTSVAGITTDLIRDDEEGAFSYLLHCERSSGQSLYESLLSAAEEFTMAVP